MNRDLLVRDTDQFSTNQGDTNREIAIGQTKKETQETVVPSKGTEKENSE